MLLPYNVDRVTRRVPHVTYALMALNIVVFILTILVSNLSLGSDRLEGQREIAALVRTDPLAQSLQEQFEDASSAPRNMPSLPELFQRRALMLASKQVQTPADFRRLYVIEHAYDSFVDGPHYSTLNSLAYHPGDASALGKIFNLFTAMFLHGSFDHLLGNVLFLWIFGRASEEFLGRRFYLSIYLCAGVGATLIQHLMTQVFAPASMGLPNIGASGAIAGVLGLFAVRFYRTKVRVFYLWGIAMWIFLALFLVATSILATLIGSNIVSLLLGLIAAGAAVFILGRGKVWGAFRMPSVWVIGIWVVVFNIVPALWEMMRGQQGGVAHWAHVGGFLCGAAYALLVGGVDEGKDEYALEDAQQALHTTGGHEAVRRASELLQKDADNPAAHEVAARGHDRRKTFAQAVPHYEKAIEGFWKRGERDAATRLYGLALENHPQLPLRPALLLGLSSHLAQNSMWNDSAAVLTRLVDEFPTSPEAEIALLRAAQLWLRQFNDPAETLRMTALFTQMFPQSQWETQVRGLEMSAKDALRRGNG
ncbi:MAG TPA: rhomboid family intramembrane serine protease [Abditibacterium sp.]